MVGLVADLERVTGLGWRSAGDAVWLLGVPPDEGPGAAPDDRVGLAAGSYLECLHGLCTGRPPRPDLELEKRVQAFLRQGIAAGLVASAHDLSDGGLAVAAAECCIASGLGVRLTLPEVAGMRPDRLLFAEGGARILVSVPAGRAADWRAALDADGLAATPMGEVEEGPRLEIRQGRRPLLELPLERLRRTYEQAIPRRMRVAAPPPEH
jgi:phosphoribosylformylglycinamidine synthase